jgi:ABC-type cobalamin transport system ATPase subunit
VTKAGYKFLSWAKPQETRATADNYIENGWPISDMINAKSQELSDCERIRNRIAHNSLEAVMNFNAVQRNLLRTERLFPISPGQFLRIRNARLKKLHIGHYLDVMRDTLAAILDPPP